MDRRKFIKTSAAACATVALMPKLLPAQTDKAAAPASAGAAKAKGVKGGPVPEFAKNMLHSDMNGLGPDGKPTGQK
ncbi:MAG: twin-arginine translocation signal domain-containing protein, partial [Desulfuromonadales bacterium]|nr:twin-arginine translocation signal domain-containing protein [Desulfuromonadales bacterium]